MEYTRFLQQQLNFKMFSLLKGLARPNKKKVEATPMDDYVNARLQTFLIKCWVYGDYKTESAIRTAISQMGHYESARKS